MKTVLILFYVLSLMQVAFSQQYRQAAKDSILRLKNSIGVLGKTVKPESNQINIDLEEFPPAMYFIKNENSKKRLSKKVLIKN